MQMNYKDVRFGEDARSKMIDGINVLANAVKSTLGPRGRNVVIKRKFTGPQVTKDGVTVAKNIHFRDEFMDIGAQMVLEAASQTNTNAGDGTTTSTVLAQAIINEGIRYIDKGVGSVEIKRGIDKATEYIVALLKEYSNPIDGENDLISIARISANSDDVIASLITAALNQVGADGVINVERGGYKDTLEISSGMRFSSGYINANFTSNDKLISEVDKPYIILIDKEVDEKDLIRCLTICAEDNRAGIIVAQKFTDNAITLMINNFREGRVTVCPIEADGYGDRRTAILEDVAIYTGGVVFNSNNGLDINKCTTHQFGSAERVTVTSNETAIIGKFGKDADIETRVQRIKTQMQEETSQYALDRFKERLGSLTKGVALIKVGAHTEAEMKEKKDRVDDAVCAVRASIDEGYLPGGGIALLRLSAKLDDLKVDNEDQMIGVKILQKAIKAPFYNIISNAGKNPEVIEYKVLDGANSDVFNIGYDASKDSIEDMIEAGVIDPCKVTRVALQNAASIAGIFLTTEVAIGWDGVDKTDNIDYFRN